MILQSRKIKYIEVRDYGGIIMREYKLGFINDKDFYNHVKETVKKYRFQIDLKEFNSNLVDPIKLTFDSKIYKKNMQEIIESEIIRQIDKSNTNHIGYFHQNIFKFIGNGWSVPDKGYDIINPSKNYYVEMKNKHNTMNAPSSQKTYMRMLSTLIENPKAKCLLVEVIARNSQDTTWNISLDGNPISKQNIRRVSIDKFYELVTGDKFAFKNLCEALPLVLDDIISDIELDSASNSVFNELEEISPNLLKSIYLLSFEKYEGFEDFDV